MPFRYYIIDLIDDYIKGTNNEETAKAFAESEDYKVIDTGRDELLAASGERFAIPNVER